jgi:hypothetical protein
MMRNRRTLFAEVSLLLPRPSGDAGPQGTLGALVRMKVGEEG